MITIRESKNSLKEAVNLINSGCLDDIKKILSLPSKRYEILVSGKGCFMLWDDEGMNCIKNTPFSFSNAKATLGVASVRGGEPCPVISFTVGKETVNIAFKKDWIFAYANQTPKYPGDWALYSEATDVVDFTYSHVRTLRGETDSLAILLKMKHADDERSDDSEQPLPIFDSMSISIKAI